MEGLPPALDLLTWMFGNENILEDAKVLIEAKAPWLYFTKKTLRGLTRQYVAGWRRILSVRDPFTVCVHMFNSTWYPPIVYGIIGAGGRFTGTNPAYTPSELEHHFRIARVCAIVTEACLLPKVLEAAQACDISPSMVFVQEDYMNQKLPPEVTNLNKLLLNYEEEDWVTLNEEEARSTPVGLFSTSGTSGLPKIAIRTHANYVAEGSAMSQTAKKPYHVTRVMCIPGFHAFGFPFLFIDALRNGIPTYVMRRFEDAEFRSTVFRNQISETALTPSILINYVSTLSDYAQQSLKSLETVYCGGAPLGREIQAQARLLFAPTARIVQVWGMTEAGCISTFPYPELDDTGSVGRPLAGVEVKTHDLDDPGKFLPPHTPGELLVRGLTVMPSYLDNPAASRAAFTANGFLKTGDVGQIDIRGKIYVHDRVKDLIKLRGWQVSPSEIESVLLQHPRVADAAVIGVPAPPGPSPQLPAHPAAAADAALHTHAPSSSIPAGDSIPLATAPSGGEGATAAAATWQQTSHLPSEEIPHAYVVLAPADAIQLHRDLREGQYDAVKAMQRLIYKEEDDEEETRDLRVLVEGELRDFCRKTLARYKVEEMKVVVVREIPRGATGKVLRRVLREGGGA